MYKNPALWEKQRRFRELRSQLGGYDNRKCSRTKTKGGECSAAALPWLHVITCHAHATEEERHLNQLNEKAAHRMFFSEFFYNIALNIEPPHRMVRGTTERSAA